MVGYITPKKRKTNEFGIRKQTMSWKQFMEGTGKKTLTNGTSEKTVCELLDGLSEKEVADYCRYLQFPEDGKETKEERVKRITETWEVHPEYILYVVSEEEYQELKKEGITEEKQDLGDRLLAVGLAEFIQRGTDGSLLLAKDSEEILGKLNSRDFRKKIYRNLERMDKEVGSLVVLYGCMDMDSLYEIYQKKYRSITKEDFLRFIYWHGRMKDLVLTGQAPDGTAYICRRELKLEEVASLQKKYAEKLDYRDYSCQEIEELSKDLNHASEWVNILFDYLHYMKGLPEAYAVEMLEAITLGIAGGFPIDAVYPFMSVLDGEDVSLEIRCDGWTALSGLMLDFPLPMLKGRTRLEYAEEQRIECWATGMVETSIKENNADVKMYEFPAEIQEKMYLANNGDEEAVKELFIYQKQQEIRSEEFLYLLAENCILLGYDGEKTDALLEKLQKSSRIGRKGVRVLKKRVEERIDVADDWQENESIAPEFFPWTPQVPVVRVTPKVGRNDPCPCGSGKKFKRCCGR